MQKPNIPSYLIDKNKNFTLEVLAYRPLTTTELHVALETWKRSTRRKTVPRNKKVTVFSTLGANPHDNFTF